MEHAKKMVIISQDALQKLQTTNVLQSTKVKDTVSELDSEMLRLLNDKNLSDQDKWTQYQQVLQRYLHFSSEKRKPIQLPLVDVANEETPKGGGSLDIEEIVDTFPKTYKQDARNLLRAIQKRKDLFDWDNDGIIYINGERIPNSNVTDVLHDVIRARKSTQPTGWHQFMNVLKQINMPHEFITNPFSREFLTKLKESPSDILDRNTSLEIIRKIESDTPNQSTPVSRYVRSLDALYGSPYKTPTTTSSTSVSNIPVKKAKAKWERFKI